MSQELTNVMKDVYAYVIGAILISLAMEILKAANLTCNGVAGIALTMSYITSIPPGILFGIINVPFFLFGLKFMARDFIRRTSIFTLTLVAFSLFANQSLHINFLSPIFASVVGGTTMGMGVLAVLRHSTGVGGTGILAYWLGESRNWHKGATTLLIDVIVVSAGAPIVGLQGTLYSLVGAACSSLVVLVWLDTSGRTEDRSTTVVHEI